MFSLTVFSLSSFFSFFLSSFETRIEKNEQTFHPTVIENDQPSCLNYPYIITNTMLCKTKRENSPLWKRVMAWVESN